MIKVNKINDKIFQIRIIDTEEKSFHGTLMPVLNGVSYTSYLVLDEDVTLIDTFEMKYYDAIYAEIDKLLNGRSINNIIINHVEPDHSESFKIMMDKFPSAKVFCSKQAVREMQQLFFFDVEYNAVGEGSELKTGAYTFNFFETPLVHWPDNMWTYLVEEKILFSNDGFGQLICDDVYSDKEIDVQKLLDYSKEYYCNIIYPHNTNVLSTLKRFKAKNWEIKLVATGHGIMIEENLDKLIEQYEFLANQNKENKAVIVYETIWGNTEEQAKVIAKEFEEQGIETKVYKLSESRISEIITEVALAKYIAIGTGNQNNCMFPIVADFIERLKGLNATKNNKVVVFGAYGWAPIPFADVVKRLEDSKYNVSKKPIIVNFKLNDAKTATLKQQIQEFINE